MWNSKIAIIVLLTILGSTALVMGGFLKIVQPGPEGTTTGVVLISLGLLLDVMGAICVGWILGDEQPEDQSPPEADLTRKAAVGTT